MERICFGLVERAASPTIRFDLLIEDGKKFLIQYPGALRTGPYRDVFEALKVCRERRAALEAALSGKDRPND